MFNKNELNKVLKEVSHIWKPQVLRRVGAFYQIPRIEFSLTEQRADAGAFTLKKAKATKFDRVPGAIYVGRFTLTEQQLVDLSGCWNAYFYAQLDEFSRQIGFCFLDSYGQQGPTFALPGRQNEFFRQTETPGVYEFRMYADFAKRAK